MNFLYILDVSFPPSGIHGQPEDKNDNFQDISLVPSPNMPRGTAGKYVFFWMILDPSPSGLRGQDDDNIFRQIFGHIYCLLFRWSSGLFFVLISVYFSRREFIEPKELVGIFTHTNQGMNKMIRMCKGGMIAMLGFLLSPLSWRNDLLVNIPLAFAFAFPFGLIAKDLFFPMMILGYWITNIGGFMLMHYGYRHMVSKENRKYTRKEVIQDIVLSLVYTLVLVILIKLGWLQFLLDYVG